MQLDPITWCVVGASPDARQYIEDAMDGAEVSIAANLGIEHVILMSHDARPTLCWMNEPAAFARYGHLMRRAVARGSRLITPKDMRHRVTQTMRPADVEFVHCVPMARGDYDEAFHPRALLSGMHALACALMGTRDHPPATHVRMVGFTENEHHGPKQTPWLQLFIDSHPHVEFTIYGDCPPVVNGENVWLIVDE